MSVLKQQDIEKLNDEFIQIKRRYVCLSKNLFQTLKYLQSDKAKEYLFHGVARRLSVLERCVENVFRIFPPERTKLLSRDELKDVQINLHAFCVNVAGLLDNLAWVIMYKTNGDKRGINKKHVGLFHEKTRTCFSKEFLEYLDSGKLREWHDKYQKDYRDALAHRIPLYVPPKTLNSEQRKRLEAIEQKRSDCYKDFDLINPRMDGLEKLDGEEEMIGEVYPCFVHSLTETENKHVVLHAQMIADFKTVEEVVKKFCETIDFKTGVSDIEINRDIGNPDRTFTDGVKLYELKERSFEEIVVCFEDRITNWYFELMRSFVQNTQSNFMLVATCCILIDLLSQYIYGEQFSSPQKFKLFIREHLKRCDKEIRPAIETLVYRNGGVEKEVIKDIATGLYVGFRCGVVHSARILEFGRINRDDVANAITLREWIYGSQKGMEMQVNPEILLNDLEDAFKVYLKRLRAGDCALVINFKKKFKFEYGIEIV